MIDVNGAVRIWLGRRENSWHGDGIIWSGHKCNARGGQESGEDGDDDGAHDGQLMFEYTLGLFAVLLLDTVGVDQIFLCHLAIISSLHIFHDMDSQDIFLGYSINVGIVLNPTLKNITPTPAARPRPAPLRTSEREPYN